MQKISSFCVVLYTEMLGFPCSSMKPASHPQAYLSAQCSQILYHVKMLTAFNRAGDTTAIIQSKLIVGQIQRL